jgi:hypothetical protein
VPRRVGAGTPAPPPFGAAERAKYSRPSSRKAKLARELGDPTELPLFRRSQTIHTGRGRVHSQAITGPPDASRHHEFCMNCHHDCHHQLDPRFERVATSSQRFCPRPVPPR